MPRAPPACPPLGLRGGSRPSRKALAPISSKPPSPRGRALQSAGRPRGGGTWPRGVRGAPAPPPAGPAPARARAPHSSPRRPSPGWRTPRPAPGQPRPPPPPRARTLPPRLPRVPLPSPPSRALDPTPGRGGSVRSATAAAAPWPRCWQRPPPRQPRGRASPGSKPAFSPRVRACVCASRPAGPRPGREAASCPAGAGRGLAPGAGIRGLGPRPPGRGRGLRDGRPRGPLLCPPAGACLSLPRALAAGVAGGGDRERLEVGEVGGRRGLSLVSSEEWWGVEREGRGPLGFLPEDGGQWGVGARWGAPLGFLNEDSRPGGESG